MISDNCHRCGMGKAFTELTRWGAGYYCPACLDKIFESFDYPYYDDDKDFIDYDDEED